jgi:hypothetical protein
LNYAKCPQGLLLDETSSATARVLCHQRKTLIVDLIVGGTNITEQLTYNHLATSLLSEAYISFMEGPESFYLQPCDMEATLQELEEQLATQQFSPLTTPVVGEHGA